MKRRLKWLTCLLAISMAAVIAVKGFLASGDVVAANKIEDPVGVWRLKCTPPDGKARECVVAVSRAGGSLRGEYTADGVTRPARRVVFEEGVLVLEVDGQFAGKSYALTYKGAPRGNALQGMVRFTFGWASGSFAFDGERIEEDVASAQ